MCAGLALSSFGEKNKGRKHHQLPACSQEQENIYQALAQTVFISVLSIYFPKSITETIHKIHNPQEKRFKPTSAEKY